jgi:DNA-binding SARP family transcriptional activator
LAAEAETRIQLCGNLVVRLGGRRIDGDLPGRQGRIAFAFLVVNRLRPVSRDQLAEALWPVEQPALATTALNAIVSKLRRAVGQDILQGRGDLRLALPADTFVDLESAKEAIHRAEAGCARSDWAGVWGPGRVALHISRRELFSGEDAPWLDEQRRLLGEIELRALECIAESSLGLGRAELESALRSGYDLVGLAPHRESGCRLLMRALDAKGNCAEALGVYEELRQRLRDELGIAPSAPTQELYRRLLG